jgi:hypothetical protein
MQNINKESYGEKIYINFGQTLVAATDLTMSLMPKAGPNIDVTPTLETSRLAVGDEYYEANEFVSYTTTDGMFDDHPPQLWKKMATAVIGSTKPATKWELFRLIGRSTFPYSWRF